MDPIKSSPILYRLYPLANPSSSSSLLLHVFQNKQTLVYLPSETGWPDLQKKVLHDFGLHFFCFLRSVKCRNTNGEEFCLCGFQRKKNRFV